MKRLFARKDKPTAVSASTASDTTAGAGTSRIDDGLLAPTTTETSRRKSSFLLPSKPKQTPSSSSSSGGFSSSAPLTTSSFSGSSNASSSHLAAPVDESVNPPVTENGSVPSKTWPSWVASIGKKRPKTPTTSSFANVSQARGEASNSTTAHRSSTTNTKKATIVADSSDESASEESSEESWGRVSNDATKASRKATIRAPASGRRRAPPHSTSTQTRSIFGNGATSFPPLTRDASKALTSLHAITLDALVPPVSHPPLVQNSGHAAFPRSSNKVRPADSTSVGRTHTPLHAEILRKRLLKRIERRTLTAAEQASIQPLAHKSAKPRNAAKRKLPAAEDMYEDSKAVGGGWSKGMKKWASRPCFEDRVVQYLPSSKGTVSLPVEKDVRFGVAALEFSEGAEALAGLHRQNELPPPPTDIYVPASNRKLPPPLVVPRVNKSGTAKSFGLAAGLSQARAKALPSRLRPTTVDSSLLAGQEEDDLPLGVVMSRRRQQEQQDTEEQEARKQRVAAAKAERERKAREEEEKNRRLAEEVIAARARRDKERAGKKAAKDAWLEGDADALPPPLKPFAGQTRSHSNPNFSPTSSTFSNSASRSTNLQVPVSSSASSITAIPTNSQRQDLPRRQTSPMNAPVNSPWTGLTPSTSPVSTQSEWRMSASLPQLSPLPMPMSAPAGQYNYGMMMMPPVPDPTMLSMFEQNLMRPWVYGGTPNGSTGNLTPPMLPFVGSSGDSAGSLTPPRFPHSRPSSWAGSNEDIVMMRKAPSSPGHRPNSGMYSSGGSAEDWHQADRNGSKGDLRASNGSRFGSVNGTKKTGKKPDSPPKNAPGHQRQISSKSAPGHDSHSHSHSHHHQRQKSSAPSTKSHGRGNESPRSSSIPPLPTTPAKTPYGLPTNPFGSQPTLSPNAYATASVGRRSGLSQSQTRDMSNGASNTSGATGFGSLNMRPQRSAMPSILKSGTTSSERRSRLFA